MFYMHELYMQDEVYNIFSLVEIEGNAAVCYLHVNTRWNSEIELGFRGGREG